MEFSTMNIPHLESHYSWMNHRESILALVAIILVIVFFVRQSYNQLKVPVLLSGEITSSKQRALEYYYRPRELILKGYQQYPDTVYGMDTRDVIPPRFLDELKSHPLLSFKESIDNDMLLRYTYFGGPPEYVIHAIKSGLTVSLRRYTPILHQMARANIPKIIGKYKDWTPVVIHDGILQLVGTSNARVFLGTSASCDPAWIEASTGYVLAVFDAIRALKKWSPWMRPFVNRFIPEKVAIKNQWAQGRLRVRACMEERRIKGGDIDNPPTMLDHLSSGKNAHLADDVEKQLLYQMTLVAVGTVTTFASAVQAIYDLAIHLEHIPELLQEIESVPTDENGHFTKESISAMHKLDSFIKESQRLGAADLSTFQRCAVADMSLPDGTFLPKGTKIEVNTFALHHDNQLYENADTFDGFRFYRQRQQAGHENKHLYVSSGKGDLAFGYGRHACPGRYLGHVNIMLVVAEFLRQYDVKTANLDAPKSVANEALVAPDAQFRVLMKSR